MKKILLSFLVLLSYFGTSQDYDFQALCIACAEAGGFYCGDNPDNWTQYAPNGCVPNGPDLFYLNDGWEDCVDGSDEQDAAPTTVADCGSYGAECDTVYVEIPVVEYEYIYQTDTIIEYETIIQTEYIYITDTIYADVLDTMFIDVIEYVEIFVLDTLIEYVEVIDTEYIDCVTGLPCNTSISEIIKESQGSSLMYNIYGQHIRKPKGVYIQNGEVKWRK
jgi:hypothetical protein